MVFMQQLPSDHADLHHTFGMGVAGNFAGHLEQAGEAADFVHVTAELDMPKGIFPWYAPGSSTFLGAYPLSHTTLALPDGVSDAVGRIQIEPELGVMFDVVRSAAGDVETLIPRWAAAFDDCSLRRPGAARISEKKNWGAASKGVADRVLPISDLARDGALASMRLTCLLVRDGETIQYGTDSAIATYTLFGTELIAWLVDRLNHQHAADDTPLEDVGALLHASGASTVLVGVGATRYEPYGETTFVQAGDEAIVAVYDASIHTPDDVAAHLHDRRDAELTAASVLRRVAQ